MRKLSAVAGLGAAFLLASCRDIAPPTQPANSSPTFARADQDRAVYIVTFKEGTANVHALSGQLAGANGSSPLFVYEHTVHGFAAPMSAQAAEALTHNPNVASVELDQTVQATVTTELNATWGIDRLDQGSLPLSGTYDYSYTGSGVTAYIIDTGILPDHVEFGGRVTSGFTAISDGRGTVDCNGHGTHVSGTVGGSTYGVAKGVTLVPVRVLNCQGSGTTSGVIAGIDWVAGNAQLPAVANMSLGGGASSTLDDAVNKAINAGVTFAVAAGNDNANACNYSPARAASAITVGATTSSDARASYSNYGSCLDVFAPGSSITSAWNTSTTATNTISGTSMATPHVTGVAALYLQQTGGASPAQVATAIRNGASAGLVSSAGSGSPNLLLNTAFVGGGTAGGGGGGGTVDVPVLTVTKASKGANNLANLSWTVISTSVSVYRNGSVIASGNGTSYQDNLGKSKGTFTYKVCSGSNCSAEKSVTF